MIKIEERKLSGRTTGNFIVAVNVRDASDVQVFENCSEEYVVSGGYSIIRKCTVKEDAEKEMLKYKNKNRCYIVRITPNGFKLETIEGILTIAPMGTLGAFRKKRLARKFLYEQKNKKSEENRKNSQDKTAVA